TFDLKIGQIINLGSGTEAKIGMGKLISVLSVDSLLHLNDLGKSGYSYSSFAALINLSEGKLITQNAKFAGPVASIMINGTIDTKHRLYDAFVTVQPHLTSSLPLLAGVLINPIAGVVAWAADKLIVAPTVDNAVSVQYKITGDFANPTIEKIQKQSKSQQQAQTQAQSNGK
ncbi:MAG: hypothetical protein K5Q00_03735, partial [Gammaproteobacteria bacterium]|nr:hypothetical protein [Gammaproteobacteria bacterium]